MENINYCSNDFMRPSDDVDFCVCPQDAHKVEQLQKQYEELLEKILENEEKNILNNTESHAPVTNSSLFLICDNDVDDNLKPWFHSSKFLVAKTLFINFTTTHDAVPVNHREILMKILENKNSGNQHY